MITAAEKYIGYSLGTTKVERLLDSMYKNGTIDVVTNEVQDSEKLFKTTFEALGYPNTKAEIKAGITENADYTLLHGESSYSDSKHWQLGDASGDFLSDPWDFSDHNKSNSTFEIRSTEFSEIEITPVATGKAYRLTNDEDAL